MEIFLTFFYVIFIGILSHFAGQALPRKNFDYNKFPFAAYGWEKGGKIYEKIGVRKWKHRLPDMSRIMPDMMTKTVNRSMDSATVDMLIRETCVAEVVHKALCLLSAGIYFIWEHRKGALLSAMYIILNIPFIIIQRYNRPHLIMLRQRILKKEERKSEPIDTFV